MNNNPPSRPLLSSIRPSTKHGTPVTLGFCTLCGTVRVFNCAKNHAFPDSGYWIECRACQQWTFFFRIERSKVVHVKNGEPVKTEGAF